MSPANPTELANALRELRLWAGMPSLRRLRQLGGTTLDRAGRRIDALPEATTSYLLRGRRPAKAEFVHAFVAACLRARLRGPDEIAREVDRWHTAWRAATGRPQSPAGSPGTDRPAAPPMPRQLPPDIAPFTGRVEQLAALDAQLRRVGAGSLVASVISGMAGVGKTALSVHWAHRVVSEFPDGQLYVDLQGFGPRRRPMDPSEVVRLFLDALAVPPQRIPAAVDAQIALYRSLLAGQRMLVVLDNARDAEQVRPLLPGSGDCMVVVTSRNELSSLVTAVGAQVLNLDQLSKLEARELLASRLDGTRLAADPGAAEQIVTSCGGLPLALAIVAARAAHRSTFPLAVLARQLCETPRTLDALDDVDPTASVRAAFSSSYRALSPQAARLLRLLGVSPGADITTPAVASLAGVPQRPDLELLLGELARVHLIAECVPGRYTLHDLVRAYAVELAHTVDSENELLCAEARLLDHYRHTAHRAALLLRPGRKPPALTPPESGVVPEDLADHGQAMAWLRAERAVLRSAIEQAANHGFEVQAWQLAWALQDFLDRQGRWQDLAATNQVGLRAAIRLSDRSGQATAHQGLARAYSGLGRHEDAATELRHALECYGKLEDLAGMATAFRNLSLVMERLGSNEAALGYAQRALEVYPAAGHEAGRARALNGVGWCHALLGRHQEALTYCSQALALLRETGDRSGQANAWDSLGYIHHQVGHYGEAVLCYQRALHLQRRLNDRYYEAMTLVNIGEAHRAAGAVGLARRSWERAVELLDELDHSDSERARAKLHDLGFAGELAHE